MSERAFALSWTRGSASTEAMALELIEGYRNLPGVHCGSTAMRNLLYHYVGLELTEAEVFGLGSGLDSVFFERERGDPPILINGRGVSMEVDVASALGVDYREQPEVDDGDAWQMVRAEVQAGRPTMLSGDVYYLDYRNFGVHFPAHRFVLVGFDDEALEAIVADRIDAGFERCSYAALRQSRNPPEGLSTHNLWGRFHSTSASRSLPDAYMLALRRSVRRMLGDDRSQVQTVRAVSDRGTRVEGGLAGLVMLEAALPTWADRDDVVRVASYNSRCIEKFGNGGGHFRPLYASFLESAQAMLGDCVPQESATLARLSGELWSEVARVLASIDGQDTDGKLARCVAIIGEIRALETRLFEGLDGALGSD